MSDDEISDQDIASIDRLFDRRDTVYRWRSEQPYDGVLGKLPMWAPEWQQRQFEIVRNRLLDNGAYGKPLNPRTALGYLNIHTQLGNGRDSTVSKPGEQGDAPEWIPQEVMQDVGYLAHVRWATSLGEEDGLLELSGSMAVSGLKVARGRSEGGKKAANTKWEESEGPQIVATAKRLLASGELRRGLATKLSKRFSPSARQINRILKSAGI